MIDIQEKKRKILSFLEANGPSLPVRIAKAIEMDPVFASAISSELLGSKQIKTSHMKIGSSPLYLLPGQEKQLENYTENLKSIEKEAYLKLKEVIVITDEDEEPATRVALRNIKDFATPFKLEEKIMWKYSFALDEEVEKLLHPEETKEEAPEEMEEEAPKETEKKVPEEVPKAWEVKKEEIKQAKEESKKIESIFEEEKKDNNTKEKKRSFLEKVEIFLDSKDTKIISIEEVDKNKVIARTKTNEENAILFAFNKKKINEVELMKCYKKAKTLELPYHIIILGSLTKKMDDTMDAYKKLIKIDKLENTEPEHLPHESEQGATAE